MPHRHRTQPDSATGELAAKDKKAGGGEGEDTVAEEGAPRHTYIPVPHLWSCAVQGGSIERIKDPIIDTSGIPFLEL